MKATKATNMWMILFLALPLAGIAYAAWHIWVLLPMANLWKWLVIATGILCFLTLFLDFSRKLDVMPLPLARVLYGVGTTSLMVLLYLVMTFLLLDLGRLLHLVPRSWLYGNWVTAAGITGLLLTIFVCGNIHYNNKVRVPINIITKKALPHPYRIVMMSDLHLGYHNTRSDLKKWVDMVNGEKADIILIAGDIIDISVEPLLSEDMAAEFRRLNAPVYACLGNHEYYSGEPRAEQFYGAAGIHLLSDTFAVVDNAITIIGRDDRTNARRKSVAQLASEVRSDSAAAFTIMLDHQPYHLEQAEEAGIDFQLSGHTHRGQVWPVSWITDALYECSWGSHRRGATQYYVSSGIGIWGGKYRIGTQSEYVVATVKPDAP